MTRWHRTFYSLLLLLLAPVAWAQTTTVTGTASDTVGNAYANGTASAKIVTVSGQSTAGLVLSRNVTTNGAGAFSFSGSNVLSSGQVYVFTVCAAPSLLGIPATNPTPQQVCGSTIPITVSGASQDITAQVNALPAIGPSANITGNAATATALQSTPTGCSLPNVAGGIAANGNANCVQPSNTTGNSATTTALQSVPSNCTAGSVPTGVDTGGNALNCTPAVLPSVTNNFTAPQKFNADISCFKGPNPYIDIRCFGARTVNPNIAPAALGITAICTLGQPSVTISNASLFSNGDGVVLYQCGNPHSMVTPTAPTVTPVVALAGTGTLITTPGPTGAATYNYYIIARDKAQGLTAPSLVGTTTTGAASLGAQTVNITSISRSGQVMTATTAAAHGFLVGCGVATCGEVYISAGNSLSDKTFGGWFIVTSAVNTTTFTYNGPPDTRLGATASATGGTATYYNANKVVWPNTVGSVETAVYSDRAVSGTCAYIGMSLPSNATFTETEFDDFGSPMMNGFPRNPIFPASFSCASPPSATSDSLSSTIVSGAGTVNLTLAANAGSSSSGNPILFDDGPALLAAIASGTTDNCTIDIPFDAGGNQFVINLWTVLPLTPCGVSQLGNLYLNDTLESSVPSASDAVNWIGGTMPVNKVVGTGAFSSYPTITVNTAMPGMYSSHPSSSLHISGVTFTSVPANGGLMLLTDDGFNQQFDRLNFNSGNGSGDFMSMSHMSRSKSGNSASNVFVDYVNYAPGGGTDGASHTPTLFVRGQAGNWVIPHSYSVHRGMMYNGQGIFLGINGIAYINGGGTPLLTTYVSGSLTGPTAVIGNVVLDTIAHPCVATLPNINQASAIINFQNGLCTASSGAQGISGNPAIILGAKDIKAQGQVGLQCGPVTDSLFGFVNNYCQQVLNAQTMAGQDYSVAIQGATPVLTSCPVSAGGSLSVGTHIFFVVPFWWNNNNGVFSNSCTAVTSTGNQTVTLNWNLIPGNPQLIRFYDGNTGTRITSQTGLPTATSAVISSETLVGGTGDAFPTGGPTMLLPGVQGIATPKLTLAGTPVSSAPISTWGGVTFGTTNTGSIVAFTPDQAITVTAIDYSLPAGQTLGATCVTQPTVRVSDGTTIGAQLTLTNSQASGALTGLSLNYPAGDNTLRIEVAVASAGCGTQWGNVNLVAHYRMQ